MATERIYSSPPETVGDTWTGAVQAYDSSHIVVGSGLLQESYTGDFAYDASGNVSGLLTGIAETYSGAPVFSVTSLSVSMSYALQLINSNQLEKFAQLALSGDDQFILQPGTHALDGYGGYNTVTEAFAYSRYAVSHSGAALVVSSSVSHDTLYDMQGVYFQDGFYNAQSDSFSSNVPGAGFIAVDTTTGNKVADSPTAYAGPVIGLQHQYVATTVDSLNVSVSTDNWFIHSGRGTDALTAHGGTNVLDGGAGSNFLTGGNGVDTFFVDDRVASAATWSTVVGFHAGDATTIWGVTPKDFTLAWADGQGAAQYTGLTLHATAAGRAAASLTLAGFTNADLSDGRISISYGSSAGNPYMYAHCNS